jgi:hypothetical protein
MLDLALFVVFSDLTYAYCYFFPVAYYQGYKKGEAFAAYDSHNGFHIATIAPSTQLPL